VFDNVMAEVVSVRLAEEVTCLLLSNWELPREQKSAASSPPVWAEGEAALSVRD
jgi:hypothetical protein